MTDAPRPRSGGSSVPAGVDPTVAHSPRIWNYWLGGKDNFAIDREVGDQFVSMFPAILDVARESRAFLTRAVTFLTRDVGIRQFLDIGTGLPTADNTHEIVRRLAPDARVVYVDNDPLVLAHARAILVGPPGRVGYVDADLRRPSEIITAARERVDLTRPVGLILMNILGHVPTTDEARSIVRELVDALPAGSHLVVSDGTNVIDGPAFEAAIDVWNQAGSLPYHLRDVDELASYFEGLELLDPGLVSCPRWRPEPPGSAPREVDEFGGVGRKP